MNAYDTIRSVLSQSLSPSVRQAFDALAELERAAAVVDRSKFVRGEICGCQALPTHYVGEMDCPWHKRGDGQPPPAPVAEIREVVVTDDALQSAFLRACAISDGQGPRGLDIGGTDNDEASIWLEAWRSELGPALGMVEIREPSDDECADIHQEWLNAHGIQGYGAVQNGRAMFNSVRAVMWPKEGV